MFKLNYTYAAQVVSVYDGDTIVVNVDLGFGFQFNKLKLRLARINAPEMRGPEKPIGMISRDYLRKLILNKKIYIETFKYKKGKYGRYIAELYLEDGTNVNDLLVQKGLAEYKKY